MYCTYWGENPCVTGPAQLIPVWFKGQLYFYPSTFRRIEQYCVILKIFILKHWLYCFTLTLTFVNLKLKVVSVTKDPSASITSLGEERPDSHGCSADMEAPWQRDTSLEHLEDQRFCSRGYKDPFGPRWGHCAIY